MFSKLVILAFLFASCQAFSQTWNSTQSDTAILIDDAVITDTIETTIDSLKIEEPTKLKQVFYKPFSELNNFITTTDILRNDYRYTGDFFKLFPFSFERSFGFIGQPNDIYLYAEGKSTTSYFMDGVPIRITDFNHVQSEDVDSIEIVRLPRGFLYGFNTNPVSVNFVSKDIIPKDPYSRIKYYEGPFGEAFIDAIFSMNLFKDLIASVDITNRKVDDSYKNSAFSIWQAKAKVRYNLANSINLIGSYYFSKSETGLNGGVDVDSIRRRTSDINSILFNETLAPIFYEKNSLNYKQHNFGLKVLAIPFENAYTDLSFNYNFNQRENVRYLGSSRTTSIFKNKSFNLMLHQNLLLNPINLSLNTGYQYREFKPTYQSDDPFDFTYMFYVPFNYNSFFISPILSFTLLDSLIVPSIYFKQLSVSQKQTLTGEKDNKTYGGYGIDLLLHFARQLKFYLGYSDFDNDFRDDKISVVNLMLNYKAEAGILSLEVFNKKHSKANLWGVGFNGSYKIWSILFEGRFSKLFYKSYDVSEFLNQPEISSSLGIYYRDSLFSSNLDLKAGFNVKHYGRQDLNFFVIPNKGFDMVDVPQSLVLDFTVSAVIQKVATVYFTWENLFDKKYFLTPYYPMLQRNIRFGIAWEILN